MFPVGSRVHLQWFKEQIAHDAATSSVTVLLTRVPFCIFLFHEESSASLNLNTSSKNVLKQELKNLLHICDVFEPEQCGMFLTLMDNRISEVIVRSVCVSVCM